MKYNKFVRKLKTKGEKMKVLITGASSGIGRDLAR